jgi:hypothetical protein
MTTKIERYSVDDYQLVIKPGGVITLNAGTTGSVVVSGDLTVFGSTTTISSQDLEITDNTIILNKGETGDGVTLEYSGIIVDRGTLPDAQFLFDETRVWTDSQNAFTDTTGAFTFTNAANDLVGIFTNNISTNGNDSLVLLGNGTGLVTVTGTVDYEKQVFNYTGSEITPNASASNNLTYPIDDDALINAKALLDYVDAYHKYNWQSKIVSPTPEGTTQVAAKSVAAGDGFDGVSVNINNVNVVEFNSNDTVIKNNLSTTRLSINVFNSTAEVINAFGAGNLISLGSNTGSTTVNNALYVAGLLEVLPGSYINNTSFQNGIIQNSLIELKNTNLPEFVPTAADVANAELYVNISDGKIYFKRDNGTVTIREIGLADRVANVIYVSDDSGNDLNDGTTLSEPFKTIDAALEFVAALRAIQTPEEERPITIYVKSGNYEINNPLRVPARVGIVGDNLRTVTIRPINRTLDMFWVYNGSYITQVTFKDNLSPSAAVAFPTDGAAGFITQSPYVQNCTTITTTGTGMRVDGAHATGLRSMVADAFTQYNQGGIGIHMLNRGNTQLVSIFTICCDIAFLCENGGFCSITNSNSSFGNYALKSDGVSETMYAGRVSTQPSTNQFKIDKLTQKPNIGDAMKFATDNVYYTVRSVANLMIDTDIITSPVFTTEDAGLQTARNTLYSMMSFIKTEVIKFLEREYPFFTYDEATCSRDVGLILEAVTDDMVFGTNYKSIKAGKSYYRASAAAVIGSQKPETIDAINYAKASALSFLTFPSTAYSRVEANFNTIINILTNGEEVAPAINYASHAGATVNATRAKNIIQANRNFYIEEGIAYISANYPVLNYDQTKCRRDIGFIIDALTYDIMYGGNSQVVDATRTYYVNGVMQLPTGEVQATIDTFTYVQDVVEDSVINTLITALNSTITQNTSLPAATPAEQLVVLDLFEDVINLLSNGYNALVTLEEELEIGDILVGTAVTFHQLSLITSSSHTFEWIGSGTNVNTALPYLGGTPIEENQVIQINGGRVYYTSTDQKGDFRIGDGLKINRASGTVEGRVFRKSLYSTLTPYILALGEG